MRNLLLFISTILLFSCTENDTKKDVETNTFYSKYLFIYNNHDSLGLDKTTELLDEYIEEFPNAQNAYMFKAWLLAQNMEFEKVNATLTKALEFDNTNAELYAYWSSLLLKDTNNFEKAQSINNDGLRIASNNISVLHNETWIHLFKNENDLALNNALEVCKSDTLNKYLYTKAALISSVKVQNDSIFKELLKRGNIFKEDSHDLAKFKNNDLSLIDFYNKTIKQ